jgi:hypothetical protein
MAAVLAFVGADCLWWTSRHGQNYHRASRAVRPDCRRPSADLHHRAGAALYAGLGPGGWRIRLSGRLHGAEDNLRLGRTVVADSVNPLQLTRDAGMTVAGPAWFSYPRVLGERGRRPRLHRRQIYRSELRLPGEPRGGRRLPGGEGGIGRLAPRAWDNFRGAEARGPAAWAGGGAGGIRTLEGVAPLRHFQCRALGQLGDRSRADSSEPEAADPVGNRREHVSSLQKSARA